MKTYTAGDMFRAWTEGWHAGFIDCRKPDVSLTPNPYALDKEEDHGQPPSIAVVSEIHTPCKE